MPGSNPFKILSLSLLMAFTVMAMSASAAQAKWLILVGGKSVNSAKFVANIVLSSELLVAGLGFAVNCTGGTAAAEIKTAEESTKLVGEGTVEFTECVVLEFEEACTINSIGEAPGTITASGSGYGQMTGPETFTELSSAEFTTVEFSGEECPFNELEFVISGTGTGTLVEASLEQETHFIEIDEQSLFFGEEEVSMHGSGEEESGVTVAAKEIFGRPWAIRLVGL